MPQTANSNALLLLSVAGALALVGLLLLLFAARELRRHQRIRTSLSRYASGAAQPRVEAEPDVPVPRWLGWLIVQTFDQRGERWRAKARAKLERAGDPAGLHPDSLIGWRVIGTASSLAIAVPVLLAQPDFLGLVLVVLIVALGSAGLDLLLTSRAAARRARIERDLPTLVDLLSLALGSGMGFDIAVELIAARTPGPLSHEISRYIQGIRELGESQEQALTRMAERSGSWDLAQFCQSVSEATETGSGLLSTITSQAQLLRQTRRRRADEAAQRAPIRMIVPMTLFILPVLMLTVLGPVILRVMRTNAP